MLNNLNTFTNWIKEQAIPFWSIQGLDEHGASYEKFTVDGLPDITANRRVRVQTRQMFVFSAAYKTGWLKNGMQLVAGLEQYINQFARNNENHHYVHLLDCNHQIINSHQDLYDVAFLLLAYGWRYHVFNDLNSLNAANELLTQIDYRLKEYPGGWCEGDYSSDFRRQNPHMHLFEAFLTLYKFTHNGKWLAKAGEMYCLFETRFLDHQNGVLLEYFTDDWQPALCEKGKIIEPGHMMEWVWLLRQYQKYTQAPVDSICDTLYHNTIKLGLDNSGELLVDEINIESKETNGKKRCWPMTEWLKASLEQARVKGSKDYNYLADADKAAAGLMKHFIRKPEQGRYIDQLDTNNTVINHTAPASTLYHLVMAALEVVEHQKELMHAS